MKPVLQYIPPPLVSADFTKEFNRIVRKGPTGERVIRFVWGMDRKQINRDICRYHDILNVPAKYVGIERWVLEGWQSPDVLDRAEWESHRATLGDFPEKGVWDFISFVETDDGGFLNLGSRALKMARTWRHWNEMKRSVAVSDILEAVRKTDERQERNWREAKAAILDDFMNQYIKAGEKGSGRTAFSLPNKDFTLTKGGFSFPD